MGDYSITRNEAFLRTLYSRGPGGRTVADGVSGTAGSLRVKAATTCKGSHPREVSPYSKAVTPHRHGFVCSAQPIPIRDLPDYDYTISDKPVDNWVPWVVENYHRQVAMHEAVGDDGIALAKLTTGTHLYAAAFGCQVHRFEDTNACALPLVTTADEADRLDVPDIWKSPTLYRVFELAEAVTRELGPDVYLGPPDMQSGFDTAALIWDKSAFLIGLADEQQQAAAERLVDKCARLFKTFLIELRREFPNCVPCHCPAVWCPPEMPPWLSNDECGSMSTPMFERFCLPELLDLADTFGGLGMHCCADAEHQFESFKKIPHLYAFNRVQATRGYMPILDHFAGPDAPVHVLAWVGEPQIEELICHASPGTRFIFTYYIDDINEAGRWLDHMRSLPIPHGGNS